MFNFKTRVASLTALTLGVIASPGAFAADGITAALAAVDFSGVATALGGIALVVVSVALIFKGPKIAKRVINGL